ncbi:MAG: diguanylate cyclase [Gemmatimonadaceae bacterium]|nr:diguanylate cyclase [Gemmatimonadaceae bacterium]
MRRDETRRPAVIDVAPDPALPDSPEARTAMSAPRIIVADSDPAVQQTIAWVLREHGYEVRGVLSTAAAVATTRDFSPDLLLVDATLLEGGGADTLTALKEEPLWHDLPVLVTSTRAPEEIVEEALAHGATDVVRKPLRSGELLARIGANLRSRNALDLARRQLQTTQEALAQAREEAHTGRTLMAIMREVSADLSSEEIYHVLVRRVARALGLFRCSVVLARPGELSAVVPAAFDDPTLRNLPLNLGKYPEIRVALEAGRPVLIGDVMVHPLFAELRQRWAREGTVVATRSVIALPFFVDRQQAGVFLLRRGVGEPPLTEEDVAFADSVVKAAVASIQRAHLMELAHADNVRLAALAQTDPLTQVLNRRALTERLASELDRARRYGHSVAVLMMDLDHFKQVNDTHGHLVGDGVLKDTAEVLRAAVRSADFVARYGGEEFVVVLPETSMEGAVIFAERLRERIATTPFLGSAGQPMRLSVSVGVSLFPAPRITSVDDLLSAADAALYRAKADGRNCVRY